MIKQKKHISPHIQTKKYVLRDSAKYKDNLFKNITFNIGWFFEKKKKVLVLFENFSVSRKTHISCGIGRTKRGSCATGITTRCYSHPINREGLFSH